MPKFNEDWYSDEQLKVLTSVCHIVDPLEGAVIEIGCWEGKSTVSISNTLKKDTVIAVDTWEGSVGEDENHETVKICKKRDVYSIFEENIESLTDGNVEVKRMDCHKFEKEWEGPIKFVHIDACHDYDNVVETLKALKPYLVKGGVMCGDDYLTASIKRADLNGGVERAVREVFDNFNTTKNFWCFINNEVLS